MTSAGHSIGGGIATTQFNAGIVIPLFATGAVKK